MTEKNGRKSVVNDKQSQPLDCYFGWICRYQKITAAEEKELAKRIRKGSQEALDKLVKANLRFVITVAKEYQNQGLPLNDLISEGNLGLIKAARRFHEKHDVKFISYAVWWIRQAILNALSENRVVRRTADRIKIDRKIHSILERLEQRRGYLVSPAELAEFTGRPLWEVADALAGGEITSLDAPLDSDGGDFTLNDIKGSDFFAAPDERLLLESFGAELDDILLSFDRREAEIVRLYFGLDGKRLTLEALGERFKLTTERARQIKEKALKRLRHRRRRERLRPYLE